MGAHKWANIVCKTWTNPESNGDSQAYVLWGLHALVPTRSSFTGGFVISKFMRQLSPVFLTATLAGGGLLGCSEDDQSIKPRPDASTGVPDAGGPAPVDSGTPADSGNLADAGTGTGPSVDVSTKAADLRVTLNLMLGEHMILASKATGAALGGRTTEYAAYKARLDSNGTEIGALVKAAYDEPSEMMFNSIWAAHNGFFVDYTLGVAANDQMKKDKAVSDLTTVYVPQFSMLISGATGLSMTVVAAQTMQHVMLTKAVVDAQATPNNAAATYTAIRAAFAHMKMLADPLAMGIASTKPALFPGNPAAAAVDLRVVLNQKLQEHMYLASFATGAAIGGRMAEFTAAGTELDNNGKELGAAVKGLFGDGAETMFNTIWSAHNGFFVEYTVGAAMAPPDEAKKTQAVSNLTTMYVPQFSGLLAGATSTQTTDWAPGVTAHVLMTKDVVDAQVANKTSTAETATAVATKDLMSARHMQMLGDPLAKAIVAKVPEKF
jgi:hypothetical protein